MTSFLDNKGAVIGLAIAVVAFGIAFWLDEL